MDTSNQLVDVMRGKPCTVFTDLGPDEFHRVQFRSTNWKMKNVDAWMLL